MTEIFIDGHTFTCAGPFIRNDNRKCVAAQNLKYNKTFQTSIRKKVAEPHADCKILLRTLYNITQT